uniref:Uncharacterized protein n=1 Tax=Amphimedon queenslandica TaxID=400682 RepID=A0A1X7VS07_AMPQE
MAHGLFLTGSAGMIGLTLHIPVMTVSNYGDCQVVVNGTDFGCFTLASNHICCAFQEYLLKDTKELAAVLRQPAAAGLGHLAGVLTQLDKVLGQQAEVLGQSEEEGTE